jgi:hypothetical protein
MRKHSTYISANGFTPRENREIGRLLYRATFLIIFLVSFKIWGFNIADDIFVFIMSYFAYKLVGLFLHKIGFWPRWSWF